MESSPPSAIGQLAELQRLDRERYEKLQLVQALEREAVELEKERSRRREVAETVGAEFDAVDAQRRELEAVLEDEGRKMKNRRMRLNRVRNEKELLALRYEIEVGKEANQVVEDQVIEVLETLETLAKTKAEAEASVAEIESEAAAKIEAGRERARVLQAEVDATQEERDRLANALRARDASLLPRYELIFERRGGVAVVEVREGICQGCHRMVPPQLFNELKKTAEVRLCPSCRRILFWRPQGVESNA